MPRGALVEIEATKEVVLTFRNKDVRALSVLCESAQRYLAKDGFFQPEMRERALNIIQNIQSRLRATEMVIGKEDER